MKVTHHQDKCIESLSDLFCFFQVRRYLKYQLVSGKANFVVGQNCRNVPRIRAPFGSRLKINKNSGKSKIKCNFRRIQIEGFIRLMLTCSIVFRSILLDWQGIAWVGQYLVWPWPSRILQPWRHRLEKRQRKAWQWTCSVDRLTRCDTWSEVKGTYISKSSSQRH